MRNFFQRHATSGGSILRRKPLQPYLNELQPYLNEKLSQKCEGETVFVFYDDTFDAQTRYVAFVLLALQIKLKYKY